MMLVIVGVGLVLLAIAAVISISAEAEDAAEAAVGERRAIRYEGYAEAAQRLRRDLGREPSARELIAAVYDDDGDDNLDELDRRLRDLMAAVEAIE